MDKAGRHFEPAPPTPDQRLRWPDGFGQRFIVTVDTEEEFDWSLPLNRDARATTAIRALPAGHARFVAVGVSPIYLIDHPIAESAEAVAILRALVEEGTAAVGAQLHPWVTPPFEEAVSPRNSFAGNLPGALEAAKIGALTTAITCGFGTGPLIYRAGRYGIGPRTLPILAAHGYRIDSSVRPFYDYSAEGGPDFSRIDNAGWWTEADGVVELPLTTVFTGRLRSGGAGLYRASARVPHGRGILSRTGMMSRIALTPEDMPIRAALEAVRVAVNADQPLLNFSFHSPSLVPGFTPYVRDAADLRRFEAWWDAMFALLDRLGVRAASLGDIIAALDAAGQDRLTKQ